MAGYIGNKAVGLNVTTGDILGDVGVGGVVTANAGVVVDEMTLDADTLTATDTFTVDAEGIITLDSNFGDGAIIRLADGGTQFGDLFEVAGDFLIASAQVDKDIIFKGNDGGGIITALTLDMSEGGAATFNTGFTTGAGTCLIKCATNDNIRIGQETHASIQAVNDAVSAFVDLKLDGSTLTLNGQSTGGTVIGNGLILTDGDIVFAGASHGICLGTTSATAANTLRDYEEGSFTPTFSIGFNSISYANQKGAYTKIGRLVTIQLLINLTSATGTSGLITFAGLPFSAANANFSYGGLYKSYNAGFNTNAGDSYHVNASAATISVFNSSGGARNGNSSGIGTGGEILLVGQYYTA